MVGPERDLLVGQRPVEHGAGRVVLLLREQYIAEVVECHGGFGVLRGQYLTLDLQRGPVRGFRRCEVATLFVEYAEVVVDRRHLSMA